MKTKGATTHLSFCVPVPVFIPDAGVTPFDGTLLAQESEKVLVAEI